MIIRDGYKFGRDFAVFTRGAKVTRIPRHQIYAWALSFDRAKVVDRRSNAEAVRIVGPDDPRLKYADRSGAYYHWLCWTGERLPPCREAPGSILDGFAWLSVKDENPMYRAGARLRNMLIRFKEAEAEIDKLAVGLNTFEERTANDDLIDLLIQEFDPKVDRLIEAVRKIQPTTPKEASVYAMAVVLKEEKSDDLCEFNVASGLSPDDLVALVWALLLPEKSVPSGKAA